MTSKSGQSIVESFKTKTYFEMVNNEMYILLSARHFWGWPQVWVDQRRVTEKYINRRFGDDKRLTEEGYTTDFVHYTIVLARLIDAKNRITTNVMTQVLIFYNRVVIFMIEGTYLLGNSMEKII